MNPHCLGYVSVWLEEAASDDEVFMQALDWAFRLNLPLRAVVTSGHFPRRALNHASPDERITLTQAPIVEKMQGWGAACTERGIALEIFMWLGDGDTGVNQFLRPNALCVLANTSSDTHDALLRRSADQRENAVLLCSPNGATMTRVLVLYDQPDPNPGYLESAARFCQTLEVQPIILIVADTEREAQLRQGYAEGVCTTFRLRADFDLVVGCDVRSAVRRVASWRNCSHLMIERRIAASWRHRGEEATRLPLRELADSLSLLALPEATVLDVPQKICSERASFLGKSDLSRSKNPEKHKTCTEVYRD